jgi:hypothetical protein
VPEWIQIVRERLGALGIAPEREEEVLAELAGHFEDAYDDNLERSATPQQALACAFSEVTDWERLCRDIRRVTEEDPMNERTKNLWLPGMVTLFLYWFALRSIMWTGTEPHIVWFARSSRMFGYTGMPMFFYVQWYALIPFLGAFGAWWSRKSGGNKRTRLLAGLFPAVTLLALLFFAVLLVFIADPQVPVLVKLSAIGMYILGWVVIPGAALLLGALPFLRNGAKQSTPSGA